MARFTVKLLMKPAPQKRIVPFSRISQPEKWVFIVGCCNSGTTLLAELKGNQTAGETLNKFGYMPS